MVGEILKKLDKILLEILRENNYSINELEGSNILYYYLNLLKRQFRLEEVNNIYISKELKEKMKTDFLYKDVIKKIKNKMEKRKPLVEYTSKRTSDIKSEKKKKEKDKLLYDWGIYHFHLGEMFKNLKYCKRTEKLLFVFVEDNKAYFLDILSHDDFENKQLLEILYSNWLEIFSKYNLKKFKDCSEVNIKNGRKGNGFNLMKIKEFIMSPSGHGLTSSGDSIKLVSMSDEIQSYLLDLEEKLYKLSLEYKMFYKSNHLYIDIQNKAYCLNLGIFKNSKKIW